jgi:3-oxoadipate enol-lactonase
MGIDGDGAAVPMRSGPSPEHLPPPLAFDEAGEGVPLLLLHAFPLSRRMWQPQLAGLAGCCRMVAPDLPGFGGSRPPATSAAAASGAGVGGAGVGGVPAICRMEEMAAAVVALLDARGLSSVVVCGLSMGGYVALALYEGFRERVRGLVLADTRASADDETGRQRRLAAALEAESRGMAGLVEGLVPKLVGRHSRDARPDLLAWLHHEIAAAPAAGVAAAQRGMAARPDRSALLPGIAVPALIVVGEQDELTPPAASEAMRERIPGARMVTIPDAGHLSNLEQPEAFNRALRDFLEGTAGPG